MALWIFIRDGRVCKRLEAETRKDAEKALRALGYRVPRKNTSAWALQEYIA